VIRSSDRTEKIVICSSESVHDSISGDLKGDTYHGANDVDQFTEV
jgi:hypothetical protein